MLKVFLNIICAEVEKKDKTKKMQRQEMLLHLFVCPGASHMAVWPIYKVIKFIVYRRK